MPKANDFSQKKIRRSKRLARQNRDYLDLLSIVSKSRAGLAAEQGNLKSSPARHAAKQLQVQLELIYHMVHSPYSILLHMEGYAEGQASVFLDVLAGKKRTQEDLKKIFQKTSKTTMKRFFLLDKGGRISRPLLFAVTLYIWTALECLAGDLWEASLNQTTKLSQQVLTSISDDDSEKTGLSRRHISVGLAARYGFDMRRSLGTILKSKFDFSSFDGIEIAYKQAFGKCQALSESREILKELEQVRHLIVHRGGVADAKFTKNTNMKTRVGSTLSLPLSKVADYMMAVTLGCVGLLDIVDEWFQGPKASPK